MIESKLKFLNQSQNNDLNRVKKKPYIEGKDYNGNNYEEYAKESWSEYLQRNRSIIVDLFQGQTKSTLKCLKCSTISHKFETFMYLSVPIPDSSKKNKKNNDLETFTLSQCIQEFTKEEKLEKGELWFCPKCKKHQESTKKIDLWKMPNILIIHLKRFEFNKNRKCKLSNQINFPLKDFDISNLTAGQQRDVPIYDLFAVSNHGGDLQYGHYTSYAKNRIDQNWYLFNDTNVQHLNNPDERIKSSEAYVLFYSKTSVDEFFRQTLTSPESWPHFFQDDKDNSKDEVKVNDDAKLKRKRSSKLFTYKFNNQIIDKKDSKISTNQMLSSGISHNPNNINSKRNSMLESITMGKVTQHIQNTSQLQMMNSVEEDTFQGNLDDSFNKEEGKQLHKHLNTTFNKSKQMQVSQSTTKVKNNQQIDNKADNNNKQRNSQTLKNITQDEANVVNIHSNSSKQFFQNPQHQKLQVLQTGQSNDANYNINKPNTKFQYNIIKSTN